jgi:hypothetical protein
MLAFVVVHIVLIAFESSDVSQETFDSEAATPVAIVSSDLSSAVASVSLTSHVTLAIPLTICLYRKVKRIGRQDAHGEHFWC